jgi:hypothetical protein
MICGHWGDCTTCLDNKGRMEVTRPGLETLHVCLVKRPYPPTFHHSSEDVCTANSLGRQVLWAAPIITAPFSLKSWLLWILGFPRLGLLSKQLLALKGSRVLKSKGNLGTWSLGCLQCKELRSVHLWPSIWVFCQHP